MSDEIFYYAFAEGDQLIFSFQSVDNKELKEVEILEYPNNSRFMEYKTKNVDNKILTVPRSGIYVFRLKNGHFLGRVCRIRIDRIPLNDKTSSFNSAVKWVELPDTAWNVYAKDIVVGYDTLLIYKSKKELIKTEINEDLFLENTERVNSQTNKNGNQASVFFDVPAYLSSAMVKKNVIALAYWIGVGEESNKQWERNAKIISGMTKVAGTYFFSPLGAYALGAIADITLPSIGEDIAYSMVNRIDNKIYASGRGPGARQKFVDPFFLRGAWYILLNNDNYFQGINVFVKISVIVQTDYYEEKPYTEQKITPRYENKSFKVPIIKITKIPTMVKN